MYEREEYNITCDIYNVAPVQNLTVMWYKGDTLVETKTFDNETRVPVNQSSVLSFTPARQDNGATLRCEAYMDLQPEGPLLNVTSKEFNVTVYCKYIMCAYLFNMSRKELLYITVGYLGQ